MAIKSIEVRVRSRTNRVEVGVGLPGAIGISITGGTVNGSGHLILTLSNGGTIDAGYVIGPEGPGDVDGPASSVAGRFALFADTTGKLLAVSTIGPADLGTAALVNTGTAAGNVPVLDGSGKLVTNVLPALAITETFVVASQAAMLALSAQRGDVAVRTDLNKSFILSTDSPSTLADWKELLTPTDAVLSVAGLTGAIAAAALLTALGLSTSDSPQFASLNLGHATDTTITRTGAGAIAVEGIAVLTASNAILVSNKLLEDSTTYIVDQADNTKRAQLAADLISAATTRVLTLPNRSGVIATDVTEVTDISPTLDLRFTHEDGALFDDYFSRPSIGGYRMNSKGILVPTVSGEPLVDFGSDGKPRGVGFYGAYSNLLLRSEEFDNAAWTKGNITVTANTTTAPDGMLTADKLVEDTAASVQHYVQGAVNFVSGTLYTLSCFVKAAERTNVKLQLNTAAFGAFVQYRFTLTGAGSVTTVLAGTNSSAQIEALADGWYRCSITAQATATVASHGVVMLYNASNVDSYTGDGVSGLYVWGAQLTATAVPVPYVSTTSAAVARSADSMVISGSDFTEFFNPREGTFCAEFVAPTIAAVAQVVMGFGDTTFNNSIYLTFGPTAVNLASGVGVGLGIIGVANTGLLTKAAFNYSSSGARLAVNGVDYGQDTTFLTLPTSSRLSIGGNPWDLGNLLNGRIPRLTYWPRALSATELQRMTA